MPRQTSKRLRTSAVERADISAAPAGVHARPVDTYVTPAQGRAGMLADALAKASPGVKAFLESKHQQQVERDTAAGTAEALKAGATKEKIDEAIASGMLQRHQSPYFQEAFMRQMGLNVGARRSREILAEYSTSFNKDSGSVDEFLGGTLGQDLAGLEDDAFRTGFLSSIRDTEAKVRTDYANYHVEQMQRKAEQATNEAYYNTFRKAVELQRQTGGQFQLDPANFDVLAKNAAELGIERADINRLVFQAAAQVALEDDGNPEIFDAFKHKGKNGPASLYYTQEFGPEIQKVEASARRMRAASVAKANKQQQFELYQGLLGRIKNGEVIRQSTIQGYIRDPETNPEGLLTLDMANSLMSAQRGHLQAKEDDGYARHKWEVMKTVNDGLASEDEILNDPVLKDGDKISLLTKNLDAQTDRYKTELTREALRVPGGVAVLQADPDLKNRVKPAFDKEAQEILMRAGDDPAMQADATRSVLDIGRNAGYILPSAWDWQLNNVSPDNQQGFTQAYDLYSRIKNADPVYAERTISTEQSAMYDAYERALLGGAGEQGALEIAQRVSTKEAQQRVKQHVFSNGQTQDINNFISRKLRKWDVVNQEAVRHDFMENVKLHAATYGSDVKSAMDWAWRNIESRYQDVDGIKVPISPATQVSPDFDKAARWATETYASELGDAAAPGGYFFKPDHQTLQDDPDDRTWGLYERETGFPVMTGTGQQRVNPDMLTQEWGIATGRLKTAEQIQQKHERYLQSLQQKREFIQSEANKRMILEQEDARR